MKRTDGVKFQPTSAVQLAYIREHWATQTCVEIEAEIGVRRKTVKSIASRLGLKKDPDFLSAIRVQATSIGHQRSPLRPRKREPSPLGTHLAMLLGLRRLNVPTVSGRVHRLLDDADASAKVIP